VEEFFNFFPKLPQLCAVYNFCGSKSKSDEKSYSSVSTDTILKFKHIEKMIENHK